MSLSSINQAAHDRALQDRIEAATWKEAIANPTFGDTDFGQNVLNSSAAILQTFSYPVAVDYEAEYDSALAGGNPDPGGDPTVITDANISAAIQAHWPDGTP